MQQLRTSPSFNMPHHWRRAIVATPVKGRTNSTGIYISVCAVPPGSIRFTFSRRLKATCVSTKSLELTLAPTANQCPTSCANSVPIFAAIEFTHNAASCAVFVLTLHCSRDRSLFLFLSTGPRLPVVISLAHCMLRPALHLANSWYIHMLTVYILYVIFSFSRVACVLW